MPTSPKIATQDRLLQAAIELFATHGYKGTTVAAVSEAADANIAAVNYHFGDKQQLYLAALREAHQVAWEVYPPVADDDHLPPEDALRFHIRAMMQQIFSQGPEGYYARMFAKEIAEPSFAVELIFGELLERKRNNLLKIVSQLLGEGAPQESVQLGLLSIVSQIQFHNFNRVIREMQLNRPIELPSPEQIADHILEFSLAGIRNMREQLTLQQS
ncbi:CerR family C-terminal domain-containing protein [Coraliomargarita akajimensis]|nr:CerR family C-terminal domain-containing protein [Coraliomargarita akajimensis]